MMPVVIRKGEKNIDKRCEMFCPTLLLSDGAFLLNNIYFLNKVLRKDIQCDCKFFNILICFVIQNTYLNMHKGKTT